MDGENDVRSRQSRWRARRLGTVGVVVVALVLGGLATSVFAARSRIHPLVTLKNRIERNASKGREFTRDLADGPAQGGNITAWFYKQRLQKLAIHLFGRTGQIRNTYYLSGKWLVCVGKEQWKYNRPIASDSLSHKSLKMCKIKQEEFYLGKSVVLRRATPKSKLTTLSASSRKSTERRLTTECAQAARVLKTRGNSTPTQPKTTTPSKRGNPSKSPTKTPSKSTVKSVASAESRRT